MLVSKSIFEKIRSYVLVIDQEGKILLANSSFSSLPEIKSSDIEGQMIWEFMKPFHKNYRKTELILKRKILLKNKFSTQFETKLELRNRFKKYILWDLSVDEEDRYVLIGNDITERKNAEKRIQNKNKILQDTQKDFLDSVNYAQKLQEAILPNQDKIKEYVRDSFILYKPKDIVSGDAYWLSRTKEHLFIAAIDCTGHGIPGAMLTILANNLLREIILKQEVNDPGEILNTLDKELMATFNNDEHIQQTLDGLDIVLIRLDKASDKLSYAAALRPLFIVRNSEYFELKGDRYPIGLLEGITKDFKTYTFDLQENDSIYLYSDGYADQFGGPKQLQGGKKFTKKKLRELLLSIQDLPMEEQLGFLDYIHNNWKQDIEQTDDIVVIGLKFLKEKLTFI
ncbi:MAG: SpoIIE family protein phosphatase [Brumimicrobium sp.]